MGKTNTRNPETIEEARQMLLEDNTELESLRGELETLRGQMAEKDSTIENLRTLNQSLYLRATQGEEPEEEEEEEEPESLEDFAKNHLKGVIK